MCVQCLIAIWDKGFISLWIMELGFVSLGGVSQVVVCIVSLIPTVITMASSTIHPS